jgi:hypothetical protein
MYSYKKKLKYQKKDAHKHKITILATVYNVGEFVDLDVSKED